MEKAPNIQIRRGREEDEPYIRGFTKNTFEWGDYVGDAFASWLEGEHDVYVAEVNGIPVAVTCVAYPAQGEAWFQGIRVHPDYRRMGIAHRLTEASIAGAKERGAHVCRANIDSDNFKSSGLAESFGFRRVTRILEFVMDVCGNTGMAELPATPEAAVTVAKVDAEDAGSLFDLASKEIHYLGSEYVWIWLNLANLRKSAAESTLLAARDGTRRVIAGALLGEMYQEDSESGHQDGEHDRLDAGMGSFFGTPDGIRALINHAAGLVVDEACKRGLLPGRLFLSADSDSPALQEIRNLHAKAAGELDVPDDIGLWELPLS